MLPNNTSPRDSLAPEFSLSCKSSPRAPRPIHSPLPPSRPSSIPRPSTLNPFRALDKTPRSTLRSRICDQPEIFIFDKALPASHIATSRTLSPTSHTHPPSRRVTSQTPPTKNLPGILRSSVLFPQESRTPNSLAPPQPHPLGRTRALLSTDFNGKSHKRNSQRIQKADRDFQNMLGESPAHYLSSQIPDIFDTWLKPPPLQPARFPTDIDTILRIAHHTSPTPQPSPFRHGIDPNTVEQNALANADLIAHFDFDLQWLIDAYPNTVISPGSEFRSAATLEPLLCGHPHWPRRKKILSTGVSFPLVAEEYEPARQRENEAILA